MYVVFWNLITHVCMFKDNTMRFPPPMLMERKPAIGKESDRKSCPALSQNVGDTVDGRNPANQLRLVVYPTIYKGFIHPRWLFRISSMNSSFLGVQWVRARHSSRSSMCLHKACEKWFGTAVRDFGRFPGNQGVSEQTWWKITHIGKLVTKMNGGVVTECFSMWTVLQAPLPFCTWNCTPLFPELPSF